MQCKRYYCGKSLHQTADSKLSVACSGKDSVGVCVASCNNEKQKQECARCNNAAKPHTPGDICTYVHQYIYIYVAASERAMTSDNRRVFVALLSAVYRLFTIYTLHMLRYMCRQHGVGAWMLLW